MFKRFDVHLTSNPVCSKLAEDLEINDFLYYDKDGFELNKAEQKFYAAMGYPIGHSILNHTCWQEPWFQLENDVDGLILDHCMFLCRCNYNDSALDQLNKIKTTIPLADRLVRTKVKWGYDFALDSVKDGEIFEVLHVEYDHRDYDVFSNNMLRFDYIVRHTDWKDAANKIWNMKSHWEGLKGFEQNHWKANYLIGWQQAEYTEKAI